MSKNACVTFLINRLKHTSEKFDYSLFCGAVSTFVTYSLQMSLKHAEGKYKTKLRERNGKPCRLKMLTRPRLCNHYRNACDNIRQRVSHMARKRRKSRPPRRRAKFIRALILPPGCECCLLHPTSVQHMTMQSISAPPKSPCLLGGERKHTLKICTGGKKEVFEAVPSRVRPGPEHLAVWRGGEVHQHWLSL